MKEYTNHVQRQNVFIQWENYSGKWCYIRLGELCNLYILSVHVSQYPLLEYYIFWGTHFIYRQPHIIFVYLNMTYNIKSYSIFMFWRYKIILKVGERHISSSPNFIRNEKGLSKLSTSGNICWEFKIILFEANFLLSKIFPDLTCIYIAIVTKILLLRPNVYIPVPV